MLTDLIPAKYRRYVYAVAALLAFAYGLWEASNGDWHQFVVGLLGAIVSALAHANTDTGADTDEAA